MWQFSILKLFLIVFVVPFLIPNVKGQQVAIQNYSIDADGRVQIVVNSSANNYYVLKVREHPDSTFDLSTSMTIGQPGTTVITEPLKAYPLNHYEVWEYAIGAPEDSDNDGLDDFYEYNHRPFQGPLNAADSVSLHNGLVNLNTADAFHSVAISQNNTPWLTYLDGKEFLKFIIFDFDTDEPRVYFMNSNTHNLHADFAAYLGEDHLAPSVKKGHIIYHSNLFAANGTLGVYGFNYSNNESHPFETVQRTHELLALNMPFLTNNLSYFVTENIESQFEVDEELYEDSRVPILYESDVYAGIDYMGMNQVEGFGLLRLMTLSDVPGPKDIVIYESLPNSLPRVGGIITSFVQTPLSHVNLRAIQDNVPNAFIRDPLEEDTIADLLDHYVYFKVNQSNYEIREATLDEVNEWYEAARPTTEQIPPLNLDYKSIFSLNQITFDMYDGFGAKAANMAAMKTFGFVDGTIPEGYAIPFYYYQEFMKHNNLFEEVETLLADEQFVLDRDYRDVKLEELREKIKTGRMPNWMLSELLKLQHSFPLGSSIRCRSSTNNEDLPGFSGAGLYDSYTQHPHEGHISKSVRQVYASLWNLRAFEERDFYRINHFATSMGVLCHPNFSDELVNGVAVSADPVYGTENTFYLNSQLGEDLITNPGNSVPEEMLMKRYPTPTDNYSVIQYSSLLGGDSLLMTDAQLNQLREYLGVIHDKFAVLYHAENDPTFAMDIEYKITSDHQLAIKQARPWVEYKGTKGKTSKFEQCDFLLFPNPAMDYLNVRCEDCKEAFIRITDVMGKLVVEKQVNQSGSANTHFTLEELPSGIYFVNGYFGDSMCESVKFVKR